MTAATATSAEACTGATSEAAMLASTCALPVWAASGARVITSHVLMGYAFGLPAYIAGKVFATVFWARQDTTTPVKISIAPSLLNIVLCVCIIKFLDVAGIALATGLAGWLQLLLYRRVLKNDPVGSYDERFKSVFHKIALSTCAMAIVLAGCGYGLHDWFLGDTLHKLVSVATLVGSGGLTYAAAILLSGVVKTEDIKQIFSRKKTAAQNEQAKEN